ncbi:MAG TPA: hypothetical protein VJ385_15570 [Fibrobacteria bacterium]|nr:hypothetical protein [Fibrobacteria bacterium]
MPKAWRSGYDFVLGKFVEGLETIQLAVGKENRLARKLYAKFGFRKYAEERRGLTAPRSGMKLG